MHHRKAQSLKNVGITLLVLRINPTHCCFFVTLCNKTSTTRTHSNSASLLNGSLLVKEFAFSKTVDLQQATLLNNDLLHNYSSLSNRRVARDKRGCGKDEPFLISVVPVISVVVGKKSHS